MKHGRPYPPDIERRVRIMVELAKRNMNISDLARALRIGQPIVSRVVNGVRRSKKTEAKIAAYFGKDPRELFPPRSKVEIEAMRREAGQRSAA